jgi:hypothetical protein
MTRTEVLKSAMEAFREGNLTACAAALENSDHPIDRENAANCRRLAAGGAAHMVQMLGDLITHHLEMAEMFRE